MIRNCPAWGAILLALTLSGCAGLMTYNPATGRNEFIAISTSSEVAMGKEIHSQLSRQYKLSTDQTRLERVNRIGQRLARISDRQDFAYHFYLIEKDEMNAFTTPGGNIYFYSGLLNKLSSDDEIAAVLAHEIGHCAAKHTVKKYQAAMGYDLIGNILFSAIGVDDQVRQVATMGTNQLMNLVFSAYGRQDEFQADQLGLKYMNLAGYKLEAMIETFEVLKKESKGPRVPLILRSHPYLDDRISMVRQEIARIKGGGV